MAHSFNQISFSDWRHPAISQPVGTNLGIIVIIPSFAEEDVITTLDSLGCNDDPGVFVECIVLINESSISSADERSVNQSGYLSLTEYIADVCPEWLTFHILYVKDIDPRDAGVGLARKLAMDEAVLRLNQVGSKRGIIASLDADCTVSKNYFKGILMSMLTGVDLLNIYYEHPLPDSSLCPAILLYELHLRYYIHMQRWLKLPFAYHTVGSSFAVKSKAYETIGGMSKRKAGEDFYFIHKFSKKGSLGETGLCTVFPSGRPSHRVPFGTGRAVADMESGGIPLTTYNPKSFQDLRPLMFLLEELYTTWDIPSVMDRLPSAPRAYFQQINAHEKIDKIRSNSTGLTIFCKGFFQWFDAFRLMKYLHFSRDHYYDNVQVPDAIRQSAKDLHLVSNPSDLRKVLEELRSRDRNSQYKGINEVLALYPGH